VDFKGIIMRAFIGYLRKLFFDVKMKKYVGRQGVMREHSRSYRTEEQRSLRAYFTFRPFRMKWSFARQDSFWRYPIAFLISNLFFSGLCLGQAKKPTLMIVPSDAFCIQRDFKQTYDNQGTEVTLPDYKKALQNDPELLLAISKINELMMERGFPLKNLESEIKGLEMNSAEDALLTNKYGAQISESPIDVLRKTAKADIWLQLSYNINTTGPKKSLTFNLQGLDAYTNKQIAGASGTGPSSFSAEIPVLLEEAILANIDNFNSQLQSHFDDLFENGREIKLQVKIWDTFEGDLEEYYGDEDEELGYIIENWLFDNAVKGRFSTTIFTENQMLIEQLRIPLYDDRGRPLDARRWARTLDRFLEKTYNIEAKVMTKGLGEVVLILGE